MYPNPQLLLCRSGKLLPQGLSHLCPQIPIHIFQEHLHQFPLLFVVIKQKGKEVLILFIPGNQGVLYGVKIGKAEIFERVIPCTVPQMSILQQNISHLQSGLGGHVNIKVLVIRCIDLVDDLGQLLFHGFIHEDLIGCWKADLRLGFNLVCIFPGLFLTGSSRP